MAMNQITMTGAKKLATRAVPRLCPANKASRMAMVSGTTECSNAGVTSVSPSTADNTEIAGVIMESPMNMEAPTTPSRNTSAVRRPNARVASAVNDRVPPSPLLSARSSRSTYLIATTTIRAHRISESTPSTMSRLTGPDSTAATTATRNA